MSLTKDKAEFKSALHALTDCVKSLDNQQAKQKCDIALESVQRYVGSLRREKTRLIDELDRAKDALEVAQARTDHTTKEHHEHTRELHARLQQAQRECRSLKRTLAFSFSDTDVFREHFLEFVSSAPSADSVLQALNNLVLATIHLGIPPLCVVGWSDDAYSEEVDRLYFRFQEFMAHTLNEWAIENGMPPIYNEGHVA